MPCCCVVGCCNRTEKGHRLYYLPRGKNNEHRRKVWLSRINRKNFHPTPRTVVCEVHFEPSQFERLVPGKLIRSAVPSLFPHKTFPVQPIVRKKIELSKINPSKIIKMNHMYSGAVNIASLKDEHPLSSTINKIRKYRNHAIESARKMPIGASRHKGDGILDPLYTDKRSLFESHCELNDEENEIIHGLNFSFKDITAEIRLQDALNEMNRHSFGSLTCQPLLIKLEAPGKPQVVKKCPPPFVRRANEMIYNLLSHIENSQSQIKQSQSEDSVTQLLVDIIHERNNYNAPNKLKLKRDQNKHKLKGVLHNSL